MRLFQNNYGNVEIHVAIIDASNNMRVCLNGAGPRRWDIYYRVEPEMTGPVLKQVGNSLRFIRREGEGLPAHLPRGDHFQGYLTSFKSRSINSVSYGLMTVLTFRAVAEAPGAAATLATAVATAVVMADVRAAMRASRAADGTTASPLVFYSSSAFPRRPRAILLSIVDFLLKASAL